MGKRRKERIRKGTRGRRMVGGKQRIMICVGERGKVVGRG